MATNRQLVKAMSSGKLQVMSGVQFISPVQNWEAVINPAALFNVMDYYMNQPEIDEQLMAMKKGWA